MTTPSDFAAVILSHGRANMVHTYGSLRSHGYTGRIIILIDDLDSQRQEYIDRYGSDVHVFCKADSMMQTDACDNTGDHKCIVFARNASFDICQELGVRVMLQLDDDYKSWAHVLWSPQRAKDGTVEHVKSEHRATRLDDVFSSVLQFMDDTPQMTTLAFAQGGDFIGGNGNDIHKCGRSHPLRRKVMNSFFVRTDDTVRFRGRGNDDVNLYVGQGCVGVVCATLPSFRIYQQPTQSQGGGMADLYRNDGTYAKSFYTVMIAPSCVSITTMGNIHRRLHHRVDWRRAVPRIIHEKYRKPTTGQSDDVGPVE